MIHPHPKHSYKNFKKKVSARELANLEEKVSELKSYAEAVRAGLEKTIGSNPAVAVSAEAREQAFNVASRGAGGFNGFHREQDRTPEFMVEIAYGEDSDEMKELKRLQSDPGTTIKQLHENYFAAVLEVFRPQFERHTLDEAFLEDIKSGRAASWE